MNNFNEIKVNGVFLENRDHPFTQESLFAEIALIMPSKEGMALHAYFLKAQEFLPAGQLVVHLKDKKQLLLLDHLTLTYRYLIHIPEHASKQEVNASLETLMSVLKQNTTIHVPEMQPLKCSLKHTMVQRAPQISQVTPHYRLINSPMPSKRVCHLYL